jgi:queuine tRNA-ribosyltransferase
MEFELEALDKGSAARAGSIQTDHGVIHTPVFMPVGTQGTVKGVHQRELKNDINAQIILGNTYHLNLRPGMDIIEGAGGLHKFIGWERPILTDSGGYQVFSLAENRKISEEGVEFRSHIDGSKHKLSPEIAIEIQRKIGADIIMAFDECTPFPCTFSEAKESMDLTHRWLARNIVHHNETPFKYNYTQSLFPIVQGSVYPDLRKESAEIISSYNCDGNAIGGLSVGEPAEEMYRMTDVVVDLLPKSKPRYLMGVGTPVNILECISLGIDMFDCVMPARNGRNGMLFTRNGIINIKNEKWKDDHTPIDSEGTSFVDKDYTKGYLRHLIASGERLGPQIATIHNLTFYIWLVTEARTKIIEGTFHSWKNEIVKKLAQRI